MSKLMQFKKITTGVNSGVPYYYTTQLGTANYFV